MELVSVNVGLPREVTYRMRTYPTSIFKDPVAGRVAVARLNLAGDRQGNPQTHGGPDMAVYAYSRDHYAFWENDLGTGPLAELFPMLQNSTNLTITVLRGDEKTVLNHKLIGAGSGRRIGLPDGRTGALATNCSPMVCVAH